ncbi:putative AC transposase [Grifola frondosa]|uniref:Putative AC transposase n=1 Tax=Grifola frondosa TaxID=5627 RepID=A0A1C7M8I7_GRIFR|nr:putative AC transposase [Grifola frondosa]
MPLYGPRVSEDWRTNYGYCDNTPRYARQTSASTALILAHTGAAISSAPISVPPDRSLLDVTTTTVNASHTGSKRRRTQSSSGSVRIRQPTKCTRIPQTVAQASQSNSDLNIIHTTQSYATQSVPQATVDGVGPSTPHPSLNPGPSETIYGSLMRRPSQSHKTIAASDVWYFMRGLDTDKKPSSLPRNESTFKERPRDKKWVGCRLCQSQWKVWKCTHGQTDAIRTHLKREHFKCWRDTVILERLKGWEDLAKARNTKHTQDADSSSGTREREPFTQQGFYRCLVAWIVADDQNALGCVSFTSDLWTDQQLRGFMAVTLHYCAKDTQARLALRARLGAFRYVRGSHTGANLAAHFLEVVEELGIIHKIGMITLNNASNCSTMMEELEYLLHAKGVAFDREGNRIRCFPHVVNIAVQTGLKQLTKVDDNVYPSSALTDTETNTTNRDLEHAALDSSDLQADIAYAAELREDPVAKARTLVRVCRASQQRREEFDATIVEGNKNKEFTEKSLPEAQLLLDVDTQWSSTFAMIDRVLELYQAVKAFLAKPKQDPIACHALSVKAREVLGDVREFLQAPHMVQEVLSAQKTPTLSMALPGYEKLILALRLLRRKLVRIAHAISASIVKLEEYLLKSRNTRIYAIAMIINPTMKFEWLSEHWAEDEVQAAREWLRDLMLEFRKSMPKAARSQVRGFGRMNMLLRSLSGEDENSLAHAAGRGEDSQLLTEAEKEEAERQACERDAAAVDDKLRRYSNEGLVSEEDDSLSLIAYWETTFPTLYRIALDVLPVQASAVPCERVFSSSKETDTQHRTNLDVATMEMLQVLKYSVREDRLSFTDDWIPNETEMLHVEVSPDEVDRLLSEGKIDELVALLESCEAASLSRRESASPASD